MSTNKSSTWEHVVTHAVDHQSHSVIMSLP